MIPLLLDMAVKGAALLALAGVATAALRHGSAALRHLVWSLAMAGLLALPLLCAALPQWQAVPRWSARAASPATAATAGTGEGASAAAPAIPAIGPAASVPAAEALHPAPAARAHGEPALPWTDWLLPVWAIMALVCLLAELAGRLALWNLSRVATRIEGGPWFDLLREFGASTRLSRRIVLLQSDRRLIPMAWGLRKARILLPAGSQEWAAERRRAVLLHEIAHVRRKDCLTQFLTNVACALHWFDPLVWVARRRMITERERACDDLVLAAGIRPSQYAEELMRIAGELRPAAARVAAVAMARQSGLEARLRALFDERRNRVLSGRALRLAVAGVGVGVIALACAATPFRGGPTPVETLMANYRANPDNTNAFALANVLSFRDAPTEEGDRILRLLCQPALSCRQRYAEDKPIVVRISEAREAAPSVHGLTGGDFETIFVDGRDLGGGGGGVPPQGVSPVESGGSNINNAGTLTWRLPKLREGKHEGVLRVDWRLWRLRGKKVETGVIRPDWDGPYPGAACVNSGTADTAKPPAYEVRYEIPFTINVVPDAEAEKVATVSSAEMDAAIRDAFRLDPREPLELRTGRLIVRTPAGVVVGRLPVDVVFDWKLLDETGKPWPSAEGKNTLVLRADRPQTVVGLMIPYPINQYPLGHNRGTLVLTPDPEAAYLEPDIKTIWGGRLKIPIEFDVSRQVDSSGTEPSSLAGAPTVARPHPSPSPQVEREGAELTDEVVRAMKGWTAVKPEEGGVISVDGRQGARIIIRHERKEYAGPAGQQAGSYAELPEGPWRVFVSHVELIVLPASDKWPEGFAARLPWLKLEQEHFVAPAWLGQGRGFSWFARGPIPYLDQLRSTLALEGGQDWIAFLVAGLVVRDDWTKGFCGGPLLRYGDKALPYLRSAIEKARGDDLVAPMWTLAGIRTEAATKLLLALAASDDPEVKGYAEYSFIRRPFRKEGKDVYLDLLRRDKYILEACEAVSELGWKDAVPLLDAVMAHPADYRDYRAAFETRRELTGAPVPAALKDAEGALRDAAIREPPAAPEEIQRLEKTIIGADDKEEAAVIAIGLALYATKANNKQLSRVHAAGAEIFHALPREAADRVGRHLVRNLQDVGERRAVSERLGPDVNGPPPG